MNQPTGGMSRLHRPSHRRLAVLLALLAAFIVYFAIISAGTFRTIRLPPYINYYGQLAQGFAEGHTWYPIAVPKWVIKLRDPYDPMANLKFDAYSHDMVLFHGRLYSYWGPLPALVIWGIAGLFRIPPPALDDACLVLFFVLGIAAVMAALILRISRRLFPDQPAWLIGLCLAASALATPLLCLLCRPSVYEAAIAGGQFFLLGGLLCAFVGVDDEPRIGWLAGAGLCWALALGCRISLAPAIAVVAMLTIWRARRRWITASLGVALPLFASIFALLAYNQIRFGSLSEFGLHYQLAGTNQHALHSDTILTGRYFVFNVLRYLFSPPLPDRTFPFVDYASYKLAAQRFFHFPTTYGMERLIGVVWCVPFLRLAFSTMKVKAKEAGGLTQWLCLSLAAAGLLGIAPCLLIPGSTMRYLNDATPSLCLLASIGLLHKFSTVAPSSRKGLRIGAIAYVVATIVLGLLIAAASHTYLQFANPSLWRTLHSIRI